MKTWKRATALLLVLLAAFVLTTPVLAGEEPAYYVFDEAGLFGQELDGITAKTKKVSDTLGVDVVVLTTDVEHGYGAEGFAEALFDEMEYGSGPKRDGIVLYIDMYNRELVSFTNGYADDWLYRYNQKIVDAGYNGASNADYAKAMHAMLDSALDYGLKGNGYAGLGFWQLLQYKFSLALVGKSLGIGAIAAAIVVGIMLAMHYTGSPKTPHAAMYFGEGGMRTTHAADYFIHTHTTRTAIPQDNGGGSSGGSRGGGGGGGGRSSASRGF